MKPIVLDCSNLRLERQRINNLQVYNALIKTDKKLLKPLINQKELNRVLLDTELTENELLQKCKSDFITAKILAGRISKQANRQGTKDEETQLLTCAITGQKCGIIIEKLNNTDYRPLKVPINNKTVVTKAEFKTMNLDRNDCLKSFDGRITGRITGWITSKITIDGGGHQDNVNIELNDFCEWVIKYGDSNSYYIVLWDTNNLKQFESLKERYKSKDKLLIVNHIQFQEFLINKNEK